MKDVDERPFVASCRTLEASAPLGWVKAGWSDYRQSVRVSLVYGAAIALISIAVTALAWFVGRYVLVLAMLSGFIFIAPLLATGLYSVARQVGRGERPSVARSFGRMRHALGNAMIYALVLMVIFLVWARAASMVHIFFPANEDAGIWGLLRFLSIGSAVGSIFALVTFSSAAFSLPMIVDRDVDMITACVTSVNAVLRNKPAMAVWISLIVGLTAIGFLTAGVGLAVVIPVLGYATYHGYEATIEADEWSVNPTR
ncbi:MAG: DUF2189 domain-containing protein [Pseudomonadota bacterium]